MANSFEKRRGLWKTVLVAGLLVGTLDILAAIIQTLINGREPLMMLKFIASGVFGKSALTGDTAYAFFGLFFHYCIAMVWTTIFFIAYPKINFLAKNRIATGIGYGVFVWVGMSQIVLPLSNTPALPFNLKGAIIAVLILIVAIGIPLSFMANKFYRKGNSCP